MTDGSRSWRKLSATVVFALLLGACAAPQSSALLTAPPADLPESARLAEVPFYPQERYYCGPASLAMALTWSGVEVDQHSLAKEVYTPGREGALRNDLMSGARRYGRLAVPVHGLDNLLRELAAGHPVIVFQNLALDIYPQWHFAVAIGYDLKREELILHSGTREYHRIALDTFERTWARGEHWAMVVLPPDELPATAEAIEVTRAAAGIERAERLENAATAYGTILARWPDSLPAGMGLANVRYKLGDLDGTQAALERVVEVHPESAPAWNNLAHVLNQQGRHREALDAIQRAIRIDDRPAYRETMREIAAESG